MSITAPDITLEERIKNAVDAIHTNAVNTHFNYHNELKEPTIVYHYTSLASALSILESKQFRLTDMKYLNDPSELHAAVDMLEVISKELFNKYVTEDNALLANHLLSGIRGNFISAYIAPEKKSLYREQVLEEDNIKFTQKFTHFQGRNNQPPILQSNIYSLSFSEKPDHLRAWISYANNAEGVSLGFKPSIGKKWPSFCENIDISNTNYRPESEKKKYLRHFLEKALKALEELIIEAPALQDTGKTLTKIQFQHFISLYYWLERDMIACKNENYEDEEEWRLFTKDSEHHETANNRDFFVSGGLLKPYKTVSFDPAYLSDVWLGPCCDPINKHSIKALLKKHGYSDAVEVHCSTIPYRG